MVQFNEWFDENVKASHMLSPFVSWLENKGIQGIYDAAFEPETLFEEWASFLFYLGRKIATQPPTEGLLLMAEEYLELTAPLQNSIEIGETSKGDLYLKSCKIYFGTAAYDDKVVLNRLFKMYDEARKQINERSK